ncbi:MAG: SGNH/GDSL hydrolase family protein [Verrucomicrobiales bacterium]|nr:SGNH/GDSL hydrolase family protein [Verrucomicrobiales bacterium]
MFCRILTLLLLALPVYADPPKRSVIVFGDSITAGSALPAAERGSVWVNLVEQAAAGTLKMTNEGKGGRPSNSVGEFEKMLPQHSDADALVIALGMNDSRDITPVCVPKAVANLRGMIGKARQAQGAKFPILIVGPTNINKSALGPTKPIGDQREQKLRELGAAFSQLAKETGCHYVSLFGVVPHASLLKDGVHPDAAGNAAIASVMQKAIGGIFDH